MATPERPMSGGDVEESLPVRSVVEVCPTLVQVGRDPEGNETE